MKEYFDKQIVRQAELHAQAEYPKEACGFILDKYYHPIVNVAEDPVNDFKIRQEEYLKFNGEVRAIMHSHADYPHLSKQDMISQIKTAIPWGIVFLHNGAVQHTLFWGDQLEPQDLVGRPFIHGLYDCYSIVRDYWRLKGYDVMQFPRDNLWWEKDPSMLENLCHECGFDFIDESKAREGDVIFMKIQAPVVNHSAILLKDGLIVHHLYDQLSRREPINRWRQNITGYLRYIHA